MREREIVNKNGNNEVKNTTKAINKLKYNIKPHTTNREHIKPHMANREHIVNDAISLPVSFH